MNRAQHWLCIRAIAVLVVLLLSLLPVAAPVSAATTVVFRVNNTADAPDANPGDGSCATAPQALVVWCTLRAAIDEVNAGSTGTILLPDGLYQLDSQLVLRSPEVHIWGEGADRTIIDGKQASRVFDIAAGAYAEIAGVMIENGRAGPSVVVPSHTHGGGIHNHGSLYLHHSALSANSASAVSQPHGGAIYNANAAVVRNVTFSYNYASMGGAIYNGSTIWLSNVTINQNYADSVGGGIYNTSVAWLKNSIVANNDGINAANNCAGPTPITDAGYNLQFSLAAQDPTSCGASMSINDPQLDPVSIPGGAASFFIPSRYSPAIDAGDPTAPSSASDACATDDQRFVARPQDGNSDGNAICDIGAIERQPSE
jgi:CSLREA domain-containing protein